MAAFHSTLEESGRLKREDNPVNYFQLVTTVFLTGKSLMIYCN